MCDKIFTELVQKVQVVGDGLWGELEKSEGRRGDNDRNEEVRECEIEGETRRDGEGVGEKRMKKRVVTKLTIHTRPRASGVPGNGANDMPGPSLVNGTFREFLDGFVELGIPRTGPRRAAFPSLGLSARSFFLALLASRGSVLTP